MDRAVDVHTHYVPKGWPDLASSAWPDAPWLRVESESDAMIMLGSKEFRRIGAACWDAEARLADMDADIVQAQVVSPTPVFFSYGRSPAEAARIATIFNDFALELCAPAPDRAAPCDARASVPRGTSSPPWRHRSDAGSHRGTGDQGVQGL